MLRRIAQTSFGFTIGVAAQLLLPGHHSWGFFVAGALSLAGASGGVLAGERFLPADAARPAGFLASALGALAMLLIYGVAVQ